MAEISPSNERTNPSSESDENPMSKMKRMMDALLAMREGSRTGSENREEEEVSEEVEVIEENSYEIRAVNSVQQGIGVGIRKG